MPIVSGEDTLDKPPQIPISDSDWQSTPVAVQALVISLLHGMERVGHLEQVVEQQVSMALAAPTEEALDYVRQQPRVNMDESGWRERRRRHRVRHPLPPGSGCDR